MVYKLFKSVGRWQRSAKLFLLASKLIKVELIYSVRVETEK